jgi:hypothetical protein
MNRKKNTLGLLCLAAFLGLLAGSFDSSALAYSTFYGSRCASCHGASPTTCDGCHTHKGTLSAVTDQDTYAPGSPLVVTLRGGQEGGWIGAILYDENGEAVVDVSGQGFPVDLPATAPMEPGLYEWNAAWYGNNNGTGHIERLTPVAIQVTQDPAGVEDDPGASTLQRTWGKIKSFFQRSP